MDQKGLPQLNQPARVGSQTQITRQSGTYSAPADGQTPNQGQPMQLATPSSEAVFERAKQVVLQYSTNPYALSEAIQELKGEYLKQQFNIKLDDTDV